MMKKFLILAVLPALLFFACSQESSSGGNGGGGEVSAANTISDLPDMQVDLPSSLSGATTGSGSLRTIWTVENVPGVRSEGWKELNEKFNDDNPLMSGNIALVFLDELKQYADETIVAGGQLEPNTVYNLGTRDLFDQYTDLDMDGMESLYVFDLGSFYITEADDVTRIYWSVDWPTFAYDGEITQTGTQLMRFYFVIDESLTEETVTFLMTSPPSNPTMQFYSYYDGNEGLLETYNEDQYGSSRMKAFFTDENLKLYEYYNDDDPDYGFTDQRIAYGNDQMGGLICLTEDNWMGSTEYWASSEYFDGTGNLVLEQWGRDGELPYWTDWAENDGENISGFASIGTTAPESIWVKRTQPQGGGPVVWEYTTAADYSGASWTAFTNTTGNSYIYSLYWKVGTDWAPGDANYWYTDGNYSEDGTNFYSYMLFEKGDEIPASSTFMGHDFTLSKTYPLNSLLPLSTAYANDYDLVSDEGTITTYTWTDEDLEEHTYSWTNYDFYLVPKTSAGVINENTDLYISGLNEQTYYSWDYLTGESSETKAYVFSTCGDLPAFFNFNSSDIVSTVDAQLNAEYTGGYSTWLNHDYSTEFSALPADSFYTDLED